jgi:hypothetical protein
MTAGKLASAKPSATTDTLLYRSPIGSSASAVLNVTNQGSSASTYKVGLRDYDQILTVDASNYEYRKGNVVSTYQLDLIPGVQANALVPGSLITTDSQNATFRYLDVVTDDSIIEVPTKVDDVGNFNLGVAPTGGTIAAGDTLTGANGLTALVYSYQSTTNAISAGIPDVTSAATNLRFANLTNVASGKYVAIPGVSTTPGSNDFEIVLLGTFTGFISAVTRAQFGTTASAHKSGSTCSVLGTTATTTTLSSGIDGVVTSLDVASATGLTIGNYIKIDNELMEILGINGTTIDVSRGRFGTTAAAHLAAATVSYFTYDDRVILNFFDQDEVVTVGPVASEVNYSTLTNNPFSPTKKFVYDIGSVGIYQNITNFSAILNRTYRFLQNDSSNTNHSLRFRLTGETAEYATGVSIVGIAGSAGAYTQIDITSTTSVNLNIVDLDEDGLGGGVTIDNTPLYNSIYVYDIDGTISVTDSFDTGSGSNDVGAVHIGPYGYVHSYSGTALKVSLGLNSVAFAEITTSITGSNGTKTITVGSATGLVKGMSVSGTGIASGARITAISGTTVTLSIANTGAVSGTGTFEHMLYDSPREVGVVRSFATVSSLTSATSVNAEDYILFDKSLATKVTDKNTSIVVGPGQSIVVNSSVADLSYVLNGFEDTTSDFEVLLYNRVTI